MALLGALDQSPSAKLQSVYISKYNRFVDNIIGKINRILGRSYDPVRVKIQPKKNTKKTTTTSTKKKTTTKRKSSKRPAARKPQATNKMAEIDVARAHESEVREPAFVLVSKAGELVNRKTNGTVEIRSTTSNKTKKNKTRTKSKTKKNKTKANTKNGKQAPKVRATLFGLSSLRRDGDVNVHTMTDHTTVKSDFVLGPLTLRVEKEVRVDSVDNHEKTKEFMWRRSARLAKVVSRKLAAAVKSMLQPPPTA
ncbi:hypothetical protein MML48_8g00013991 [Holotrichia oblita]|uniref:Uncharacterized protein n=1 Tax=Holotrichia oblita TaxID=644536 RepID=A0ACB9SN85_HOLOL|nr:hypothetical protein MML48_8g00013991 [Holotrichia oblita]